MTEEYKFIAQNSKGAIELQDGIYLPLEEVEDLIKKYTEKKLTLSGVGSGLDLDEMRIKFDEILNNFSEQDIDDWLNKKG